MTKTAERTMQYEEKLPPLPLPELQASLDAYLRSCEPLLSKSEFEHTRAVCRNFLVGIGPQLQEVLQQRAKKEKNWLEEWWESVAYLSPRYPAAINVNWYGVLPGNWGPRDMSQCEAAAIFVLALLNVRRALLEETYPPEKMFGRPLSMFTYTRMFNSCVIPGETVDAIRMYDIKARHIVVLRNNCIWTVQVLDDSGAELPFADILRQIELVREEATGLFDLERFPPVSVLTSENRTTWAKVRKHMIEKSKVNRASIELVESSIFCVALDETSPRTRDEIAQNCLLGDGRNRWFDKPFTLVIHENARGGMNGNHAWADALIVVRAFDACIKDVKESFRTKFADRSKLVPKFNFRPKRLDWELDPVTLQAIEGASAAVSRLIRSIDVISLQFQHYGNGFLKRYKITPDSFVQLAIQLAHYKLHGNVPAVYESAHTRLFYHGRTETLRALTNESLAFVKLMGSAAPASAKWDAMQKAIATHKKMLQRCLLGQGFDRHLLGLRIVAEHSHISPSPAIFTDKAYDISTKFQLSTSNISGRRGASPIWGGFAPMCTDGYGVCYAMQPDRINVSITANHSGKHTSAAAFHRALETAFLDMVDLCLASSKL